PHAGLHGEIPAERRCESEPGNPAKDLYALGTRRLLGEGRLGDTTGGYLPRLPAGQGVCREVGPTRRSSNWLNCISLMSLGQRRMDQGVHSVLETFLNCSGAKGSSAIEGRFNPLLKFKFSTARLKKPWRSGKLETMRCRVNFFKDLVSPDGQPSSRLQQSI